MIVVGTRRAEYDATYLPPYRNARGVMVFGEIRPEVLADTEKMNRLVRRWRRCAVPLDVAMAGPAAIVGYRRARGISPRARTGRSGRHRPGARRRAGARRRSARRAGTGGDSGPGSSEPPGERGRLSRQTPRAALALPAWLRDELEATRR
jgi:hypothetical protein